MSYTDRSKDSGFMNDESSAGYIGKILNSKKIRYEKLNELFENTIPTSKQLEGSQVNIYVDIASIIKQLYNPELLEHFRFLKEKDRIIISSEIINIIGHYRHYFTSRKRMYTRFFFYFSYAPSSYHTKLNPTYRKDYYDKRNNMKNATFGVLSRILQYNMKIIRSIINYIPNAYFIDSGAIEPAVIPHYIISEIAEEDDFNLLLVNDDLYYQDLFIEDRERTYILEMRGSDKSPLLYKENLLEYLLEDTKKTEMDFPNVFGKDILIMDGMVKHNEYDLKSIGRRGYSTSMAAINKIADRDVFSDSNYTVEAMQELASDLFASNEDNQEAYKERLVLVNHRDYMNKNFEAIQNKVESQIIDLTNNVELMKLNEQIYYKYPLNLMFIMESEVDRDVLDVFNNN